MIIHSFWTVLKNTGILSCPNCAGVSEESLLFCVTIFKGNNPVSLCKFKGHLQLLIFYFSHRQNLYFLSHLRTADGDCSHEIKRHLLLGRKVMTNLDSIFKSRDITLPTKVRIVKAMDFPVVKYGCESWTGEDSWESLESLARWGHNHEVTKSWAWLGDWTAII